MMRSINYNLLFLFIYIWFGVGCFFPQLGYSQDSFSLGPFSGQSNQTQQNISKKEVTVAKLKTDHQRIRPGQVFYVCIDLLLPKGWHTYWENPGDTGYPIKLTWDVPNGFVVGDIEWLVPSKFELSSLVNFGYEDIASFLVPIRASPIVDVGQEIDIQVEAEWLVCKDVCIPEFAQLSTTVFVDDLPVQSDSFLDIQRLRQQVPTTLEKPLLYTISDQWMEIQIPRQEFTGSKVFDFFPLHESVMSVLDRVYRNDQYNHYLKFRLNNNLVPVDFKGVLVVDTADGLKGNYVNFVKTTVKAQGFQHYFHLGLVKILFFAFVGGFILNLMPCVFPVLSLKLLTLVDYSKQREATIKRDSFMYLLGIVSTFLGLGLFLYVLRQSGLAVGWGFQLQSPEFVLAMSMLFFWLGMYLLEYVNLPGYVMQVFGKLSTSTEVLTKESSGTAQFWTGVLACIVATPCTAPFMAAAIGFSLTQPLFISLLIFLAMGVGMASPFVLIGFFPIVFSFLPKPGKWMIKFKQFMAFPMFGTVLWLLWVLGQQVGSDGVVIGLLMMLGLAFLIWVFQFLKTKGGFVKMCYGLFVVGFVVVGGLSFVQLPTLVEQDKDNMHLFSMDYLTELRRAGKPVFVDVTAAWCITCQVNEKSILETESIQTLFQEKGVYYLVADWTNYSPVITMYLESFERSGVPLYVYYPPGKEPIVLPQILTHQKVRKVLAE